MTRFSAVAFAAIVLTMAACGDSPSEPTSPIGRYGLMTADGDALPAVLFDEETYSLVVTGGSLEMEADFSYVAVVISEETVDGNVSEYADSLTGTWSQDDIGALELTDPISSDVYGGLWQGRQVTLMLPADFAAITSVASVVFRRTR